MLKKVKRSNLDKSFQNDIFQIVYEGTVNIFKSSIYLLFFLDLSVFSNRNFNDHGIESFSEDSSFSFDSRFFSSPQKIDDNSAKTEKKEGKAEDELFELEIGKINQFEGNSTILKINDVFTSFDVTANKELNDLSFPADFLSYANHVLLPNKSFSHEPENKDSKLKFEKFKLIMKTVEKHLNNPKCSLGLLKTFYVNYFVQKYEKLLNYESKFVKSREFLKFFDFMIIDLREFITLFQECFSNFYHIKRIESKFIIEGENIFSRENMINFVLNILFTNEIYYIVHEIQRKVDRTDEMLFKKNIKVCAMCRPENFKIPEVFCLNSKTLSVFKKNNTSMPKNYIPYFKSINTLKNINFLKSPAHKMRLLLHTSDMIKKEISDFYEGYGLPQPEFLNSENLLTIYTYIISKAKIMNLITHLNFMEKFLTPTNLKNDIGYVFYMFKVSAEYLLNSEEFLSTMINFDLFI